MMKANEAVIYDGDVFCIEWYIDEKGGSDAHKYYEGLSKERKVQFLKLVKVMGDIGKIFDKTKFRNEGDQIFAFKPQPDRFLCFFFVGRKMIVTNGFHKKTDKLPLAEKEKALKYKESYISRVEEGIYYEK